MTGDANSTSRPDTGDDASFETPRTAFEAEWAALVPRASGIDRERFMYRAGQASRERTGWRRRAWPAALGTMTAVCAVLLTMLLVRGQPEIVERVRVVEVPRAVPGDAAPGDASPSRVAEAPAAMPAAVRMARSTDVRTRAAQFEALTRLLASGADPRGRGVTVSAEAPPATELPIPYRQRLETYLPGPASRPGASAESDRRGASS